MWEKVMFVRWETATSYESRQIFNLNSNKQNLKNNLTKPQAVIMQTNISDIVY